MCFTEDPVACAAKTTQSLKSTREAVMSGSGVIDGGATRTLGSVTAIQSVMDLNHSKYGDHGITEVDVANKPTFAFANSSQNQLHLYGPAQDQGQREARHLADPCFEPGSGTYPDLHRHFAQAEGSDRLQRGSDGASSEPLMTPR